MVERYGVAAYTNGYHVYTTISSELQRVATKAVLDGLIAYDKRHGYRGPERQYPPASSSDETIKQWRSALAATPPVVFPAAPGFARTHFVEHFLERQRGSVHLGEWLCVSRNKISVGLRYLVPFVGQLLDPFAPDPRSVAVSVPLAANYTLEGGRIKAFDMSYDFHWFNSESARHGVPATP